MPKNSGIAVLADDVVEDGVAFVLRPGSAMIVAVGQALGERLPCGGIHGDEWWFAVLAKAGGVGDIDGGASGEIRSVFVGTEGDGQFLPVDEVGADSVAPVHVSPLDSAGIVLKEKMVFAIEVDETVRVVEPVFLGGKVELRTIFLAIEQLGKWGLIHFSWREGCSFDRSFWLIGLGDLVDIDMSPSAAV